MESLNVHEERSLLAPELLARWRGLPLGWYAAAPQVVTPHSCASSPLLAMIDSGHARAEFGFLRHTEHKDIGAGAIGLFNGQVDSRYSKWQCRSVRRIMLALDTDILQGSGLLCEELSSIAWAQDTEFHDPEVALLLRSMVREIAAGSPNGVLYAQSLSLGLLLRLSRTHRIDAPPPRERGRLSPAQRREVEALIRADLAGDLSLQKLADVAGFSLPQFTRLFRNSYGQSPHRFVLQQRVARAQTLIQGGTLPLAVVAQLCGFSSQSHMTSVFARELRVSPGSLRRLSRGSAA
jgi:AraC family transcriptional regulator